MTTTAPRWTCSGCGRRVAQHHLRVRRPDGGWDHITAFMYGTSLLVVDDDNPPPQEETHR